MDEKKIKAAQAQIEGYKRMSDTEVINFGKRHINGILDEMKGRIYLNRDRLAKRFWNSRVEGVYRSNGKLFVDIYFQGDSTDTNDCEYFNTFFDTSRENVRVTSHVCNSTYSLRERADAMRAILSEYLHWKIIDRDALDRAAAIRKLSGGINPILNYYWDYYRLKYQYHAWSMGGKSVEYDAYKYAEKALDAYIAENYKELGKLTDEERSKHYNEWFGNAMRDYISKNR